MIEHPVKRIMMISIISWFSEHYDSVLTSISNRDGGFLHVEGSVKTVLCIAGITPSYSSE